MEIFCEDGHISSAGFKALLNGTADDLQSFEIAEHLEFCEPCFGEYTALLTEDILISPKTPQVPIVLAKIEEEKKKKTLVPQKRKQSPFVIFTKHYAPVAVAACLMITFAPLNGNFASMMEDIGQHRGGFFQKVSEGLSNAGNGVAEFFAGKPLQHEAINTRDIEKTEKQQKEIMRQLQEKQEQEAQALKEEQHRRESDRIEDPLRKPIEFAGQGKI